MKANQNNNSFSDMDQFIESLRKEDSWNQKFNRIIQIFLLFIAVIYTVIFFIYPLQGIDSIKRIGGFCYVVAVLLLVLIIRYLNNNYSNVDYGLPVAEMLRQTVKRYKLFQKKQLIIIPPLLLVIAAMVLVTIDPENGKSVVSQLIWSIEILLPSMAIGGIIGIFIWDARQKLLYNSAKKMLREIES